MDKITIVNLIRNNDNLLSLPQVLSEVLKEVGKDNFSSDSLAKVILKDPSLTGRILRMANSSFYHRLTDITTVNQAVNVLGATTVKCLALSSSIFQPEKITKRSGVDSKALFTYVLSIASASQKIARVINFRSAEEAFIAGLLHDMGILFFLHHYPNEYRRIIDKHVKARTLTEAETKVFGIDHCEVGRHLAEAWHLPDYVINPIAEHHRLTDIDQDDVLQNIVRLAILLTHDHFSGYEMDLKLRLMNINKLRSLLSMSKEQIDGISCSILSGTIDIAEYLGLDVGDTEEMLMKANQEIWKSYLTIELLLKERQELTGKLLKEERAKGAMESRNVAMATLSHYLNNTVMAIYGRSQIMRMLVDKEEIEKLLEQMPANLDMIDRSVQKIVAVIEEMKEISPVDHARFNSMSQALNIDDRIEKRMDRISQEAPAASLPSNAPPESVTSS